MNFTKMNVKQKPTSFIRHNWTIFKLILRLFFNDYIGFFIVLVLPLLISIIYLILFKNDIFGESFFEKVRLPIVTRVKIWYEIMLYVVGLAAFVYLAAQIADIKNTILFKKLITGFTTKTNFLILIFVLYFLITLVMIGSKMVVLSFYPTFRDIIVKETNWLWMIISILLFTLTNLSLGMLFGSMRLRSKIVIWVAIAVFFGLLFFAGLWFAPAGVEGLFLLDIDDQRILNFSQISGRAQTWRTLTYISPFQPSLAMMVSASNNNLFESEMTANEWGVKNRYLLIGDYFERFHLKDTTVVIGAEINDNNINDDNTDQNPYRELVGDARDYFFEPDYLFKDLATFKSEIKTNAGLDKWLNYFQKLLDNNKLPLSEKERVPTIDAEAFDVLTRDVRIFVKGYREGLIDIVDNPKQPETLLDGRFSISIKRPHLYHNYTVPLGVNLGWLAFINGITALLWQSNRSLN